MAGQKIYDISVPISESLVVWPGDIPVHITQPRNLTEGDVATVSELHMNVHTGTHVDAPAHFIPGGSTVETLDLEVLVGSVYVVDVGEAQTLSADILEALAFPSGTSRLLFRTRNSEHWAQEEHTFKEDYVGITEDGAEWLVAQGVRLVGIDYLSVATYKETVGAHQAFLKAGVILLEGLDLSGVTAGEYQLVCLPLKIQGIEGAPARTILIGTE